LRKQEQQIRQQVKEMCELSALKDDLVSVIVHDLRNPLTSLLGNLNLFQLKLDDPNLSKSVQAMVSAADRLRETVDDLLEVRLLEERQIQLQLESLVVAQVVQDAVATVEGCGKANGVRIEFVNASSSSVQLDRRLVRRSVENLVVNALKYSPKDGVVDVGIRDVTEGVEIDVCDRGPGVPDELKDHIFEKFGSVESSRGHARRGFGLGLYMVRLVADLHGGRVAVHDRAQGGTRFTVTLPTHEGSAELQRNEPTGA
jgi:signal transduction histidine kinase